MLLLIAGSGCTSIPARWTLGGWVADYDTAERQWYESQRELLIFYRDTRPGANRTVEQALKREPVKGLVAGHFRCMLFKSYEPDRRYVAQFGIQRAPALIVVHRDGTYHSRSGLTSADEIVSFLDGAKPPGAQPVINPHIPRRPRYVWHNSIQEAHRTARQSNRPILIVYERTLSRDWPRLKRLLDRYEVYRRLAGMAHCRISLMSFTTDAYITQFGALKLPAIVILQRDGTYDVLELPTSYEAVVRFADAARQHKGGATVHRPLLPRRGALPEKSLAHVR